MRPIKYIINPKKGRIANCPISIPALKNNKITVFGGTQVRPNIHIDDICGVYLFLLNNQESIPSGTFNAGFENISIKANELTNLLRDLGFPPIV